MGKVGRRVRSTQKCIPAPSQTYHFLKKIKVQVPTGHSLLNKDHHRREAGGLAQGAEVIFAAGLLPFRSLTGARLHCGRLTSDAPFGWEWSSPTSDAGSKPDQIQVTVTCPGTYLSKLIPICYLIATSKLDSLGVMYSLGGSPIQAISLKPVVVMLSWHFLLGQPLGNTLEGLVLRMVSCIRSLKTLVVLLAQPLPRVHFPCLSSEEIWTRSGI